MTTRLQREHLKNCEVADELCALLNEKNARYGRNLPRHGLKGVVIRLGDKVMRLENLVLAGVEDTVDEKVEDTLQDIAGYCIKTLALLNLGEMSMEGEWRQWSGMEDVIETTQDCLCAACGRCDADTPAPECLLNEDEIPACDCLETDQGETLHCPECECGTHCADCSDFKIGTVVMGDDRRWNYDRTFEEQVKTFTLVPLAPVPAFGEPVE